jgi:hypothetical protein
MSIAGVDWGAGEQGEDGRRAGMVIRAILATRPATAGPAKVDNRCPPNDRLPPQPAVGKRLALSGRLSLSPASLVDPPSVSGALFSSLNGAVVISAADGAPYLALGCLRNRTAVATAVGGWLRGSDRRRVILLACGEHWSSVTDRDGFRPCLEDQLGSAPSQTQLATAGLEVSAEAARQIR